MKPLISVIIPVFNTKDYLEKCLDSIVNQSYRNLEIIIIDDGSIDGSGSICEKYAKNDSRIKLIRQENKGVSAARNRGIDIMTGDYVHFPDSDDYLELDAYEHLIEVIQNYKCEVVNFQHYTTWKSYEDPNNLPLECLGVFNVYEAHVIIEKHVLFVWNKFFKSSLIGNTRFREDILRGEDMLFGHFVIDKAKRVYFDNKLLYHYVQSENSAVRGSFKLSQLSAIKLYDAYIPLWPSKYSEIQKYFLPNMANLMILLYFDMWNDDKEYSDKQREVFSCYCNKFVKTLRLMDLNIKYMTKFVLFRISPQLFCKIHKATHHI